MCITPFYKKTNTGQEQALPCGKCPVCLNKRISSWSFRLMQEEKNSYSSLFITLTYATKHLPITDNGFKTVSRQDVVKFLKRLRKAHDTDPDLQRYSKSITRLKYFLAAEYGTETKRPHYHLILFNCRSKHIAPSWGLGDVHFGTVNEASVGYTLKYINKPPVAKKHKRDDRVPEFQLMSKGLGKNYLGDFEYEKYQYCNRKEYFKTHRNFLVSPWILDTQRLRFHQPRIRTITCATLKNPSKTFAWHRRSLMDRMYCNLRDGNKITMPRYYKQQIYHEQERKAIGAKAALKIAETTELERALQGELYYQNRAASHLALFNSFYAAQRMRNTI